jgi:hypothetical protein
MAYELSYAATAAAAPAEEGEGRQPRQPFTLPVDKEGEEEDGA